MTLMDFYKKYKEFISVSSVTFRKYIENGNFSGVKIIQNAKRKTFLVTDENKLLSDWLGK